MRTSASIGVALVLLAADAPADDHQPAWIASVRVGNIWMGPKERPTGGMLVGLEGGHSWPIGERLSLDALLSVDAHGFSGGTHWMGLWAGPGVSLAWRTPADWLTISAVARAQYGRATVCTSWAYPMRWWGLYPELDLRAAVGSSAAQAVVDASAVYVDTIAWSGPALQIRAGGRFAFKGL